MQVNFNHLYYFWVVASEGGISKAANKLHLTPQTVSAQLNSLEERLERRLFVKEGRSIKLTEFGVLTKSYADEIFLKAQEWAHTAASGQLNTATTCTIGVTDGLPKSLISKWLSPVLEVEQNVVLDCQDGKLEDLLAQMALHKLDFILTDLPLLPDFEPAAYCQSIGHSSIGFFAPRKLYETYQPDFPKSLHQAKLVMPGATSGLSRSLAQWFELYDIEPHVTVYANDIALMKSLGRDGFGLFPAPLIVEEEISNNFNVSCVGMAEKIKQEYYIITPQRTIVHPVTSAIVNRALSLNISD
ncbi:transcriptional activator NhaR [Thalassotalea euphylliae]|uniref:transcriptional activator NhaR n=1 Tax=Thalassotalea euphylliae TaxID=1655234 RepID=UPI003632A8FE